MGAIVIINSKYSLPLRDSHLQKVKPLLRVTQLLAKAKEVVQPKGKQDTQADLSRDLGCCFF